MVKFLCMWSYVQTVSEILASKSIQTLSKSCVCTALFLGFLKKFGTCCEQLVSSLMALSDLLQGCSSKFDAVMI